MAGDSSNPAPAVGLPQTGAAPLTVFAAPATGDEFNTIGERLVPKACFKVEDLLFDFGLSFIRPEMKDHLPKLAKLRNDNKEGALFPPLSIFGHADPVGDDDLNKVLSGRRAVAFYAMLVRDVDLWEGLFAPPVKDDNWGTRSIQMMLSTVQEPLEIDGKNGNETKTAIRNFQEANGLGVDGVAGPGTRKVLFRAYMDALCGPDLELDKTNDFLAHNKDGAGGKGDFQGCSEFNPLRVFSKSETAAFAAQADHTERNQENAPNRRVVALLFAPGRRVNPSVWPCPRAKEGVAGCKKRFFPDAATRRGPQDARREFEDTKDTFGCRFYQIISDDSPCERVKPAPPPPVILGVNPLILFAIADSTVTAVNAPAAQSFVSAATPTVGAVQPLKDIVLIKKPHTNPKRVEVILKTDTLFDGNGQLTVNDPDSILLFATPTGGKPFTYNGIDNNFKGALLDPLGPGVGVFAEGKTASPTMGAFVMTLRLLGGSKKPGPNAVGKLTAIELTLDICAPRVNDTTAPVTLPQAPQTPAATPNDKFFLGRPVPIQDADKIQERAMLMVQPVTTSGFAALNRKLVLIQTGANVKTFTQEKPSNTDTVVARRHTLFSTNTPTTFYDEGQTASPKARDVQYQLGIDGLDDDGDRVQVTVLHAEIVSNKEPKDVPIVVRVPEKPDRKSDSKFFPAPIIIGRNFPIELRPFVKLATASAFQWTAPSSPIINLSDTAKEIVKLATTGQSTALNDTMVQVRLTTDLGQFLRRHRQTVVTATMDPVTSGDTMLHTDPVNKIVNPACCVILSGVEKTRPNVVPKYEMKIQPDLGWTDDDDRIAWWILGNETAGDNKYDGAADFLNTEAAKRGTKIQVGGTKTGDVLIQAYSGGFGYGMIRVHAAALRRYKYRVSRIFTTAQVAVPEIPAQPGFPAQIGQPAFPGGGGVGPQPEVPNLPVVPARPKIPAVPGRTAQGPIRGHDEALLHIKIANIFLRQIGFALVPDDSAEVVSPKRTARPGFAAVAQQPQILAQKATPAIPGSPPRPAVPARPLIPQRPDIPAILASAGNPRVGQDALDSKVINANQVSPGHFDVEVNDIALTLNSRANQVPAIRINARNEVINFAYIEQDPSLQVPPPPVPVSNRLATALLCPANHAPKDRTRQPEGAPNQAGGPKAYKKINFTLPDLGTPSTSLLPQNGIPPNTPPTKFNLVVLFPDVNWQPNSPANRDVNLLWGLIVPTRNMEINIPAAPAATFLDRARHKYGAVFAHEMGHVLGLGHRGTAGDTPATATVPLKKDPVSDGIDNPPDKNIMRAKINIPVTENFDIIQAKAVRFSELNFRSP